MFSDSDDDSGGVTHVRNVEPPAQTLEPQRPARRAGSRRLLTVLGWIRWLVVAALWVVFLGALVLGLASFASIFTGDESYGAFDGFQFVSAMYSAVFRFLVAAVVLWLLVRLARWRPANSAD